MDGTGLADVVKILFIHQNFPGQYVHIARALARQGGHQLVAFGLKPRSSRCPEGIHYRQYHLRRGNAENVHPLASETEAKVIRAEACAQAAHQLKSEGFCPDLICAHPGWGEALFLPDVWPGVPLLAYQEFFYHPRGLDTDFDSEFQSNRSWQDSAKVRMKNAYLNLTLQSASWNVSPTAFQRSTFPHADQQRMSAIHDGIDIDSAAPLLDTPHLNLSDGTILRKGDPVVTFVNRNLEPYRGCHSFIRSIPYVQKLVPNAQIVLVGSLRGVAYGAACAEGEWADQFLAEIDGQYDKSRVHFTGTLPYEHFLPLLRLSACHVYLTYPFVLSWSLLEAMSCACPVVGSATPPVQEVISDGHNGLLVDFFSPVDLAEAISEMLTNPERAAEMGHSARKTVVERYSLGNCLPRQLQLINLVAAKSLGE